MPLLAAFLYNVIAAFAAWLLKYFTQKVAVTVALAAVVSALLVALYVAARVAVAGAIGAVGSVHPMFAVGVGLVVSPHSAALLTGYVGFWSLTELYKWKVNILQLWARTI